MSRLKVLWLASWYPNPVTPYNGDFIQRHARAAAMYHDIHVIHVWPDYSGHLTEKKEIIHRSEGLIEEIIIYPAKTGFWGRLMSHQRMLGIYRAAIKRYYKTNGLPDLFHVQVPIKAGMAGLWMKKHTKLPMVVTEHWGIYNDIAEDNIHTRSRAFKYFTQQVFVKADACIAPSRYLAEGVNAMVAEKPFTIVPNVVDTKLFYYKPKSRSPKFRFLHVSNMVPLKNAEGILRAFSHLMEQGQSAELVMVGDTDPAIREYAASLDLGTDQVRFTGEIPYAAVAGEMQSADCLLLNSNIENSPCVIGEARCSGLPVIATCVGGVPELVDMSCGILIEPKDDKALSAAMRTIMERSGEYNRAAIAETGSGIFSMEVVGEKISKVYTGLQ